MSYPNVRSYAVNQTVVVIDVDASVSEICKYLSRLDGKATLRKTVVVSGDGFESLELHFDNSAK